MQARSTTCRCHSTTNPLTSSLHNPRATGQSITPAANMGPFSECNASLSSGRLAASKTSIHREQRPASNFVMGCFRQAKHPYPYHPYPYHCRVTLLAARARPCYPRLPLHIANQDGTTRALPATPSPARMHTQRAMVLRFMTALHKPNLQCALATWKVSSRTSILHNAPTNGQGITRAAKEGPFFICNASLSPGRHQSHLTLLAGAPCPCVQL